MDYECTMRAQMEVQIGNIPKNLKEYKQELCYLIKESGQRMEHVTSSLCAPVASLGKNSNEEIMSLRNMELRSPGGPSKKIR